MRKLYTLLILLFCIFCNLSAQTYEELVTRSMDYIEQKDYVSAEQHLKAAIRKNPGSPNNIMLMVNLGTVQRNLGKLEEALISYNVGLEKYPNAALIRHNRAALYCEMNNYEDALKDYNMLVLDNPDDVEAIYSRGLIYLSQKNLLAAEEDFETIIKTQPESLRAKMGLAQIVKRRGEWKEAEEIYSDLIYKYRNSADLYFNRAECYINLNKYARTDADIKKAMELGFNEFPIYVLRGQLRLAQYEKRQAKEDFLKAQELGADENVIKDFLKMCK
ncbi:MAG: tetratricopeptide repeat protein [Dysgonomonas sp.]|nr:tetratricopeptide repeat protein [Dysgonomonas sp.]